MGLVHNTVKLEKYNPEWIKMFKKEEVNIKNTMGNLALEIKHIGSTSVVGLSAKPIIDIAVAVNKLTDFDKIKDKYDCYPYSYKIDYDNDEVLIRKHNGDEITHLIHFMEINSERFKNTILFCNYLNSHYDALIKYQKLKEELAIKYANERKKYTSSKNDFIQEVLLKAKQEKKQIYKDLELWIDNFLETQKKKYNDNPIILRKINHIYRTYFLSKKLYSENELLSLAMKYHDVGSISQYEAIGSFDDQIVSHYILGKELIEEEIKKHNLDDTKELQMIKWVIRYHNGIEYIPDDVKLDYITLNLVDLSRIIDSLDNGCVGALMYIEEECLTDAKNFHKNNPHLDMKKVSKEVLDFYLKGKSFNKFKYCKTYADYLLFAISLCIRQLNSPYKTIAKKLMNNKAGKYSNALEGYHDLINKFVDQKVADECYKTLLNYYN